MSRVMQRSAALLLLFLFVLSAAAPAAARPKPWEKFKYPELGEVKLPDYERVEMANGMVVYLAEDREFPLVELSATIRVGAIYEPTDKLGLADVTGTVLRTGGTQQWSGDEIDELVEAKGMVLETWIGTTTGGAYLYSLKDDTEMGMTLLADILMHPRFDPEKIEIAKKEQSAGISRRNDEPMSIARREATKVIYGADHPLARHPEYDTINAVSQEDLFAFHREYYRPNSTYLVVIGDFERQQMIATIEKAFADWQRNDKPLPPDPELPDFPRTVNVVDKDDLTQSNLVLAHIGIRADDPNYAAIQVANRILGGGFSDRLFNEVRSRRGYAYSVGSMAGTGMRFPGVFMAYCGTKSGTTEAASDAIINEITKMTTEPVTAEELKNAKDGILNSEVFNFDTKREILDRQVTYEMYGYPSDFLQNYQEAVRGMTAEKILAAAQTVWHPEKLSILAVGNRNDWDGDLTQFGPVNDIDITIPEPSVSLDIPLATAESLSKGQDWMTRAASAMCGKKLPSLKGYHERMVLDAEIQGMALSFTIDKHVFYPDRQHVLQKTPFGDMTSVVDGEKGWTVSPRGEEDMTAEQLADAHKEMKSEILSLMMHHDQLQCQALDSTEIEGQKCQPIYVTGAGEEYILVYLDEQSSLPTMVQSPGKSPMTQAPVTQKVMLSNYEKMGGIQVAKNMTIKHDDEVFATGTTELFELNPKLNEGLFQK